MHFHVGYNMPGYLPEMDPYIVGSERAAVGAVNREVRFLNEGECGEPSHDGKHGPYRVSGGDGDYYLTPRPCADGAELHAWYQACAGCEES